MAIIILRALQAIQFVLLYFVFKLSNSCKRQSVVIDAIGKYGRENVEKIETQEDGDKLVEYIDYMLDSMEPLWATTLRGWEWRGYKNIVPADVYEKIKDYLEEG